ncbi:MAG: hypothetical protein Kow0027_12780 [Saprospiraceae bacterium]
MFENTFQGPGAGTYADHTIEILLMLLVAFALGLLLGYILWSRYRNMYKELEEEHGRLKKLHTELEKDHASLRYKAEQLEQEVDTLKKKNRSLEADVFMYKGKIEQLQASGGAQKAASKMALGATSGAKDDLKKIEGIGPKIEKLMNAAGIQTFRQLADAPLEKIEQVLEEAGPRFKLADPGTWKEQAALAADGKWSELKSLQDSLSGGRKK